MSDTRNTNASPVLELLNALIAHQRFDQAALYYFENVSKWKADIGFVSKFIAGNSRLIILYYACYLHFRNTTGLPENGATFARIWNHIDSRKILGSRALRTILSIVTRAGYLQKEPGQIDKRVVALVPTTALLESMKTHIVNTLRCLDIIFENDEHTAAAKHDAGFVEQSILAICNAIEENQAIFAKPDPLLRDIVLSSGGLETLYAIGQADLKNQPLAHPKLIAQATRSSPSQVRAILARLTEAGALDFDALAIPGLQSKSTKMIKMFLARELALYLKYVFQSEEKALVTLKA
jgi:hypothetical protein